MTEKDQKATLNKLSELVQAQRVLFEKLAEGQAEIEELLSGAESTASRVRRLTLEFSSHWRGLYRGEYSWSPTNDVPQWKRLLRVIEEDDLRFRIGVYFGSRDAYIRQARHSFGLFVHKVNEFAAERTLGLEEEAPPDCRHEPRCRTDVECTAKRGSQFRDMGLR